MSYAFKVLFQLLVKQFYKENAGVFVFVFTMMFCIISKVDGAGLYQYHYLLAAGMLKDAIFLSLVFVIWLLYVRKCVVFVSNIITSPYYSFLRLYNQLNKARRLRLFFLIEVLLLLPILLYSLFIVFVGFAQQLYLPAMVSIIYLLLLCVAATVWHVYQLDHLNKTWVLPLRSISAKLKLSSSYPVVLLRFVAVQQTGIWAGIKVFTCGVLYLIARNNSATNHDVSLAFLFYSIGILANSVLIFRIRTFADVYLSFYKSLPVSLIKIFLQYALLYLILFIPEIITTLILTPVHLYITNAIHFILCGYALLLLMNSLTFLQSFKMKDYVAVLLATFFVQYICLLTVGFTVLYIAFFILAIVIFFKRYYRFQQLQDE